MRLTRVLCKQHIGRMFKKHWKVQGQRAILETGAEKQLEKLGIPIFNVEDVFQEERKNERISIVGFRGLEQREEDVPRYERLCHVYRDHIALLEGLEQAKLLTKTVQIEDNLPEVLRRPPKCDVPDVDQIVQRFVMTSHIFNATQAFLPKLHDPARPAFNFPRVMGIPPSRSSTLLYTKFLHLSEGIMGKSLGMSSLGDSFFAVPLVKDYFTLQFEVTADLLLTSPYSLPPVADSTTVQEAKNIPLPDLSPIDPVITLEKEEAYEIKDIYPVDAAGAYPCVHTAVVFYDKENVHNLFATPVTETQILGRSLMHSFTIAAAQARHTLGVPQLNLTDVRSGAIGDKDLPMPVTIQCIQTDGKMFYFSVFQLNTLDLSETEGTRNLFWMAPPMSLFDTCGYVEGVPVLKGYNPDVFRTFLAFCQNGQQEFE